MTEAKTIHCKDCRIYPIKSVALNYLCVRCKENNKVIEGGLK